MKKNLIFIGLLSIITLMSCNHIDDYCLDASNDKASKYYTPEEAQANVLEFVNKMNGTGTRAFNKNVTVANVKTISTGSKTRSGDAVGIDTLFYIVNFSNSCGFAIASYDKNTTPVLALVEEGNYEYNENDSLNPGFEAFIDAAIDSEIKKIEQDRLETNDPYVDLIGGGGSSTSQPDKFEVMSPILKTKWNQIGYYAKFCPNDYSGCVPTAVAQICSFLESPKSFNYQYNSEYGAATMDWKRINEECAYYGGYVNSSDLQDQIALLMRFWGVTFDADYSAGGTSVNTEDAVNKMRKNFGFNVTELDDYNIDNVIADLKCRNKILIMRGNARYYHVGFVFRKYVDGHAWVVDGYIDQIKNNKQSKYVHCNWGWGGNYNGYFLSDVLNAEQDPVYGDTVTSATRSKNYRYKLKTATFTK